VPVRLRQTQGAARVCRWRVKRVQAAQAAGRPARPKVREKDDKLFYSLQRRDEFGSLTVNVSVSRTR
jgi:hypothetical protein